MANPDENVEFNLLLNAKEALAELQRFNKAAIDATGKVESLEARIRNFEQVVAAEARKAGVAFEQQLAAFERLDNKLKSSKKGGVVGSATGVDVFEETKIIHDRNVALEESQQIAKQAFVQENETRNQEINSLTKQTQAYQDTGHASQEAGAKAEEAGKKGESGANRASLATRAWSIALGILIHQGINLVIQAFQSMFTMALTGLREMESATYNLINAEKRLSEQGIAITPKDLDSYIQKIQKLDPMLSKIQATELVSSTAIKVAPALGLTGAQIDSISQSVAVLSVRNKGLGKSFEQVQSSVEDALLSGRISKGINDLGLKLNDQIVKENAVRMGLVATTKAYDDLDGKQKTHIATLSIINELEQNTTQERGRLPEYFETVDGKIAIFQARLQDLFTQLGTAFAPTIKRVLDFFIDGLQKAIIWIQNNQDALLVFADILGNIIVLVLKLTGVILKFGTGLSLAFAKGVEGAQKLIDKIPYLKQVAELLGSKGIASAPDTPTGANKEFGDAPTGANKEFSDTPAPDNSKLIEAEKKTEDELNKIFQENRDKRIDIDQKYQEKLQDIALNNQQKLEDIATKEGQQVQDAYTNYNQKIEDIEISSKQKVVDAKQESHKKEIDAERKHQEELKNLREKYLMDLEDALHARDARQILKLMQQYQIDKAKADNSLKVEQQKIQEETKLKLKQIEQDKKIAEAAAKRDLQRKLADIALAASRERQAQAINYQRQLNDAQIAHNRQLQEQQLYLQRKLRDLAAAIQAEYNLTAAGMAAINNLIGSYAGVGTGTGTTSTSTTAPANPASTNVSTSSVGSPIGNASAPSSINGGLYVPPGGGLAEGGSFLATTPTRINVAENRPELITATPLGRPGADVGKLFGAGGAGGGGGLIEVAMSLSPDLEARIVRNTLNETANVVLKINRSKV